MPADSGRKKAPEWDEVDIVENDKQKAACKYCNQIISAKIERVRTHIQKCSKRRDHFRGKAGELLIIVSRPTVLKDKEKILYLNSILMILYSESVTL